MFGSGPIGETAGTMPQHDREPACGSTETIVITWDYLLADPPSPSYLGNDRFGLLLDLNTMLIRYASGYAGREIQ